MRAALILALCFTLPAAATPAQGEGEPRSAAASALVDPSDDPKPSPPGVTTHLLAAGAAALGGAAGVLLSFPLAVPIIYVAALASLPAAAGALPLLLVVPLAAALGSGGAAYAFSEGLGPWLTGTLSGAAAGLALLVVGALVAPQRPSTLLDLHLGVLSVVGVPSLAAATTAAVVLPFFVTGRDAAFE